VTRRDGMHARAPAKLGAQVDSPRLQLARPQQEDHEKAFPGRCGYGVLESGGSKFVVVQAAGTASRLKRCWRAVSQIAMTAGCLSFLSTEIA
jgi:hypothetical protein